MSTMQHIVLTGPPHWGHLRGLCALAAKLAVERPLVVTLLLQNAPGLHAMAHAEAMRGWIGAKKQMGDLRVVAFGAPFIPEPATLAFSQKADFDPVWQALLQEEPIKCTVTNKTYSAVSKPRLAILDGMQYALFSTIRSRDPAPPIVLWQTLPVAGLALGGLLAAAAPGSLHDAIFAEFSDEERLNGREIPTTGMILDIPGLPRMYDWELCPYVMPYLGTGSRIHYTLHLYAKAMYECDGMITGCAPAYDGDALQHFDAWAAFRGISIYHMGPMRPFEPGTTTFDYVSKSTELAASGPGVGDHVTTFLDNALNAHGERSVFYISFGSQFWPVGNPEHLWAVLAALEERNIPFILAHPAPMAVIPETIAARFGPGGSEARRGLMLPWVPQQAILAHQAIGWFLTHAGCGGVLDALTQGVPLIGWPLWGDQPANLTYLVHKADVAFELIEGRTGDLGLKPLLTTDKTPKGTLDAFKAELIIVLDAASGELGTRKRGNAIRMQGELAKAWGKEGSARTSFHQFIEVFDL